MYKKKAFSRDIRKHMSVASSRAKPLGQKKTARNMIALGLGVDLITKATGLTEEQVAELLKESPATKKTF